MADNDKSDIILDIQVSYKEAVEGITKYRQEINRAKEDQKLFREELNKGEITKEEYNRSMEESNALIQVNNQKIKLLRKEIQNNIKIENEQKGSIISLNAELDNLNKAYNKLSKEGRESDIGKGVITEINKVKAELKAAEEARGNFHSNIGNYENAIKNALGLNNEFANSLMNLSKSSETGETSLKSFTQNSSVSVQAFGKSLMALMSNPVFLAIAGIAGVGIAFKFWYDYNKGLVEATRLTKQFTGLSGNELKSYRNEIQGVASAFDKDFKEVLEATNAVSKQFGISQQEALGYVKDGFVAGADANGQFLELLKEYPAYFNEAGISADQFVAVIAETGNKGIFSDKGIDAIKEANIRLREMTTSTATALDGIGISSKQVQSELQKGTTTTFEVMKKVSAKLNELPAQSKQVGTAIADIFGGAGEDAGLQYLKTLKDIDTDLYKVKEKAGELGEIQERQMQANIDLQNAVSALFDQTGGTFESMTGNAKVFVTEWLTKMVHGLVDAANWFIELYNNGLLFRAAINSIIVNWKVGFSIISTNLKILFNGLKLIFDLVKAIVTLDFGSIGGILKDWATEFKDVVVDMAVGIKDTVTDAYNNIVEDGKLQKITIPVETKVEGVEPDVKKVKGGGIGLEDMKKAIQAEKKAALDLARYKLETEIQSHKDIYNDTTRSFDDRLNALNTYQNLQRAYIEKDKELQLQQTELTESQKELIIEKSNEKIKALDKELADSSLKIMQEQEAQELNTLKTNIDNRLAVVKKGSDEELALRLQQLAIERQAELDNAEKTGADKAEIIAKYALKENQEKQNNIDYWNQQAQVEYQNQILQAGLNNHNTLALQIAAKQAEIAAMTQLEGESDAEFLNRKLQQNMQLKQLEDDLFQYQVNTQVGYMQAVSTIAGGFNELFSSLAEDNEAFAGFAKAMALYQIGIDTATALTAGIAASQQAGPFPANLIAIATTVATILANIVKAKKYLTSEKQPKAPSFATGGLVRGLGSGTSDSIAANLSNGESVLTARATSMFSPILSAFNQIGGGIPISTQDASSQIIGEDMLSRAFSRAVQALPNPVVSVQEIDNVNNRVQVLENTRVL